MDAALRQEIRDRHAAGAAIKAIARDLGIAQHGATCARPGLVPGTATASEHRLEGGPLRTAHPAGAGRRSGPVGQRDRRAYRLGPFGHGSEGPGPRVAARREEYERQARIDLGAPAYDMAHRHGASLTRLEVLRYALDRVRPARLPTTASVLSPRELEVARLVARWLSNREIADALVLSPRTVEGHVGRILTKLGFTSRTQLAVWVARHAR